MKRVKWKEIAVQAGREEVDAVCAAFEDLGTGGVVIEDPAIIYNLAEKEDPDNIAISRVPDPASLPVVKGYLPVDGFLPDRLKELGTLLEGISGGASVSITEIDEEDWAGRWREHYHPVRIGGRFLVKPSWEEAGEDDCGLLVIELDPGMAFGCGNHPTTALCLGLLEGVVKGGETVIDVGTGSGILAIGAAMLGAGRVLAVDSDPVAVRTARENAAANLLEDKIDIVPGDLLDGINITADVITANLTASLLIRLLPDAAARLVSGGRLVASGIIDTRWPEVEETLLKCGFKVTGTASGGGWVAVLAVRI